MAVGTEASVGVGVIVGISDEALGVDGAVVGVGVGASVAVGSGGVDVQAANTNMNAGIARASRLIRFNWSHRLAIAKCNSPTASFLANATSTASS